MAAREQHDVSRTFHADDAKCVFELVLRFFGGLVGIVRFLLNLHVV